MANHAGYGYREAVSEGVSAVTATNSVQLGTTVHEEGRDYIYVYNGTGGATAETIDPGRVVMLMSGSTGYTVSLGTPTISTNTAAAAFGVVVHSTLLASSYGWVCQRGYVQVMKAGLAATSAPVIGDQLAVTLSGCVMSISTSVTGANRIETNTIGLVRGFGVAAEDCGATTTTASFTAYINCLPNY